MMAARADVVAAARAYLGVPFRHQGRSLAGLDCAGLVVRVGQDLGLPVVDMPGYGRLPQGDKLAQVVRSQCTERAGEPAPGMIALMRFEAEPQHIAVIGERNGAPTLIHALSTAKRVVEHRIDRAWRLRILALFDLPGVA